jgi:hypothetical protein
MTMTQREWIVRRYEPLKKRGRLLGTVKAPYATAALLKAWKKWPCEQDPEQVQAGFYVRESHSVMR